MTTYNPKNPSSLGSIIPFYGGGKTKNTPTNNNTGKKRLREFLVEFGSTSPCRDWGLESIKIPRKDFLAKQEENMKHIDHFTDILTKTLKERELGVIKDLENRLTNPLWSESDTTMKLAKFVEENIAYIKAKAKENKI